MAVYDILARLTIDKGNAAEALKPVEDQLVLIHDKASNIPIGVDLGSAKEGLGGLNEAVNTQITSIDKWQAHLSLLKQARDAAEDTASLNKYNEQIVVAQEQIKALSTPVKEAFSPEPVKAFDAELGKVPEHLHEAEGGLEKLKEKAKEGLSIGAGFLGIQGAGQIIEGSIEKFQEQSKEARSLKAAFSDLGEGAEATVSKLEGFAEQQAKNTEFTKDEVENTLQLGKQLGNIKDPAQLENFSKRLQDFASATGKSLDEVSETIASKIEAGGRVRELGITFNPGDVEGNIDKFIQGTENKFGGFAEKIADSPDKGIVQFKKDMELFEGDLGSLFASVLTIVEPPLRGIVTVGREVTKFVQDNKTSFVILAAAIGAFTLITEAATVAEKGQAIATGIVTGAQTLLNTVMEANPIGLIIVGIAALAAGAVYLYNNVKPVHDAFDAVWEGLKLGAAFVEGFVSNEIGALVKGFKGVGTVLDGIIHLDFEKVKQGSAEVGQAIGKAFDGPKAGVDAMKKSIDGATGSMHALGDESEKAADKQIDAAKRAAEEYQKAKEAYDQYADNIKSKESNEQQDVQKEIANTNAIIQNNLDKLGITAKQFEQFRESSDLTPAQAALVKQIDDNIAHAQERSARLAEINSAAAEAKKLTNTEDAKEKAQNDDLLAQAKQIAQTENALFETRLRRARIDEGLPFTSKDELAVQKNLTSEFNKQLGLLAGQIAALDDKSKKKFDIGLNLEKAQQDLKTADLTVKVTADTKAAELAIFNLITANEKKEIDLGVRLKADTGEIIEKQIANIDAQIGAMKIDFFDPASIAANQQALLTLQGQKLDLLKQAHDFEAGQNKDTFEARAALFSEQAQAEYDDAKLRGTLNQQVVDDAIAREKEALTLRLQNDLQFAFDAEANGLKLTAAENDKKKQLELKFLQDVNALKTKYALDAQKQELSIFSITTEGLIAMYGNVVAHKKILDDIDAAQKRDGFDKQQGDLVRSLGKGEISYHDYQDSLAKLSKDRHDFEVAQDDRLFTRIKENAANWLDQHKQDIQKEVEDFISGELAKEAAHETSIIAMTAADEAGAAAKTSALAASGAAQDAANAKTLAGALINIFSGWTGIPFVGAALGITAAIGAELLISSLISGAVSKIRGLDQGGIFTVVGERQPEVIGNTTDFSHFASQLAAQTASQAAAAVRNGRPGTDGQNGSVDVRLSGRAQLAGRDLELGLQREALSRQNESLIPATN